MSEEVKKRSNFPIKIIFQDFFTDHRQKAYICVRNHWTSIVDLQNHIVNLFNLTDDIFLTDQENFLFPAHESIELLSHLSQPVDRTIIVHRQTTSAAEKIFKPTRNSTPFTNGKRPGEELEITETPIVGIPPPKDNGAVLPPEKKKRKRVRKRKKQDQSVQEGGGSSSAPEESHKRLKATASHIRFVTSRDGDAENETTTGDGHQITETPLSQTQAIVSRTLHKETTTVRENGNHSKSLNNKSCTLGDSFALEELRERLPNMDIPLLKKFPKKDDVICFKILKMSESYEPGLSKFIIGIVEAAFKDKDELTLLILSGEEELKEPQGKFSLHQEEEEPLENDENLDDDILTVKFSKLHEVRRLDLAKLGTTF